MTNWDICSICRTLLLYSLVQEITSLEEVKSSVFELWMEHAWILYAYV